MNRLVLFGKYKIIVLLIIIIGLSAFLRFHNLEKIYVFNFDEEYQATYAWTLVKDFHPIWIGVSSSFLDFYLGPYFTYFTSLLSYFSKGDPIFHAYFAAGLGVFTTALIFLTGWKIFNPTTGIIASLLYASLPLLVFFDQKYWNTMFTPIIVLLLFITLYLVKKSLWYWVSFAALLGAVLETHLEPIPLFLIGIWNFLKGGFFKNVKLVLVSLIVFAFFYWPLAVFDYYHNFSNITFLTRMGSGFSQSKITFNPAAKVKSFFDAMGRFWYLEPGNPNADEINISCTSLSVKSEFKIIDQYAKRTYSPVYLSGLTIVLLGYFLWVSFTGNKRQEKLLAVFLMVSVSAFLIFPGGSSEYYALQFLVLFTFVPAVIISRLSKRLKAVGFGLIAIIVLLGINTVLNTSDEFSLGPKKTLIKEVMNVIKDESFTIEGRGICHNWEGWRYLFKVYGRVPVQSYTDKNLGWLYPDEISKIDPSYTVILSEDRIPLKEDLSNALSIKEGGYRVYIRKNHYE